MKAVEEFSALSHGDEAAKISSAEYAIELARLASRSTLLVRRLETGAKPGEPGSTSLVDAARLLTEKLRDAKDNSQKSERDLPIRQLIPARVYRTAIEPDSEFGSLASDLDSVLDAAEPGRRPTQGSLGALAELLLRFERKLQRQASLSLYDEV